MLTQRDWLALERSWPDQDAELGVTPGSFRTEFPDPQRHQFSKAMHGAFLAKARDMGLNRSVGNTQPIAHFFQREAGHRKVFYFQFPLRRLGAEYSELNAASRAFRLSSMKFRSGGFNSRELRKSAGHDALPIHCLKSIRTVA